MTPSTSAGLETSVAFPFFKDVLLNIGWFYVAFAAFTIVGFSNAVNLTDGLDGLAIVPVMMASAAFGMIAYLAGNFVFSEYLQIHHVPGAGELSVFLAAIIGGGTGFLWYNAPPAKIFMGDTGSLALGGALGAGAVVLVWQLLQRESARPALLGFAGVAVGAAFALVTGRAKDFYLPGIWMYLALAVVFTGSVLVGRPVVGVVWAWITGRDDSWRRVRRVRLAFDLVTLGMAAISATRFAVQYHLYTTDQEGMLAVARIAMGWPVLLVTSPVLYFVIRSAMRAMPRTGDGT